MNFGTEANFWLHITSSHFPGGSFENLDKHVGDGLEVETDQKLEVIGTKSVLEASPENANELPALETTTNNETNLDDIASDESEAGESVIGQASDNEVDNENITGEQESIDSSSILVTKSLKKSKKIRYNKLAQSRTTGQSF